MEGYKRKQKKEIENKDKGRENGKKAEDEGRSEDPQRI